MIFSPCADDLAARLANLEHGRVLEIAAGTGVVTRALVSTLPLDVSIVATDLNQPMLDYASSQLSSERVTWRQADAQLLPFADGMFDAVVCQFGAMFFPDKAGAFGEAFRVLKAGGRFLLSVWDRIEANEFADVVVKAVATLFPQDPPMFRARTPHGHHNTAALEAELQTADSGRRPSRRLPGRASRRALSRWPSGIAKARRCVARSKPMGRRRWLRRPRLRPLL
jgi:SAM-dependent methyltransferase